MVSNGVIYDSTGLTKKELCLFYGASVFMS